METRSAYARVGDNAGFVKVFLTWRRPLEFLRIGTSLGGSAVLEVKLIALQMLNLPYARQDTIAIRRRRTDGSITDSELADHRVLWHGDEVAASMEMWSYGARGNASQAGDRGDREEDLRTKAS